VNDKKAITILKALANGIDPFTQTPIPNDNLLQNPEAIRAIHFAIVSISGIETDHKNSPIEPSDEARPKAENLRQWDEYCTLAEPQMEAETLEEKSENKVHVANHDEVKKDLNDLNDLINEAFYDAEEQRWIGNQESFDLPDDRREDLLYELMEDQDDYARGEEEGWLYADPDDSGDPDYSPEYRPWLEDN
jgi:hypothetical protein